ncbi:MAG: glycosyltransferase family 2 protein [Moraxellaceae bacterium]|nr:glycosyltransferase family 2 protein [Pseudobdellovibrionaceae bacterium]
MKLMNKISVVIIAKNEERNIKRCIESALFAEEIIVYDSGSTDQTVNVARNLGAKVFAGPWMGFGPTKRHATDLAAHDWILSMDADEEVSEELKIEILNRRESLIPDVGYRLPRLSQFLGRWVYHGGWYPDYQLRLFNRKHSHWSEDLIHEKVKSNSVENFTSHLNHYVFNDINHQVQTNNRYSSLQAEDMHQCGKKFSWFHFLTKPYVKFIECYFLKGGFLDGWVGYLIARNAAYSVFLKWAKLKELS